MFYYENDIDHLDLSSHVESDYQSKSRKKKSKMSTDDEFFPTKEKTRRRTKSGEKPKQKAQETKPKIKKSKVFIFNI